MSDLRQPTGFTRTASDFVPDPTNGEGMAGTYFYTFRQGFNYTAYRIRSRTRKECLPAGRASP